MNRPRILPRLSGLLLLLVHLAGQLQGLPLLAAAVAALDGEHEVQLANGHAGLCLVLHHDRNAPCGDSQRAPHHHRGLVRVLAGADSDGPHPDHLLQFTSATRALKASEALASVGEIQRAALPAGELLRAPNSPQRTVETAIVSPGWSPRWWPPAPADGPWGCQVFLI